MPVYRPDYFEDGVYHVYNRGVAKLPIFLQEEDYLDFQDILRYLIVGFPISKKDAILPPLPVTHKADPISNGLFRSSLILLGYCLMPNHFHLMIRLKKTETIVQRLNGRIASFQTLAEFIRRLCITYCLKFNHRHLREGVVFQGRYKVKNIPYDRDVLQLIKYIHLNPVIAGLVLHPIQWDHSDYGAYMQNYGDNDVNITNTELILSYFNNKKEQYKEFVEAEISEQEARILSKYIMDAES